MGWFVLVLILLAVSLGAGGSGTGPEGDPMTPPPSKNPHKEEG